METKRKPGRPRLAEEDKRRSVPLSMAPRTIEHLNELARLSGTNPSRFVESLILGKLPAEEAKAEPELPEVNYGTLTPCN